MWLTSEQAQIIVAHARAEVPREACGLIAGNGERAAEIIPIPNAAADPLRAYTMDERRLVEALTQFESRGLELIGLYHSHPNSDPIPSPTDVKQASYPDTPYLIVSLKGGETRFAAWTMRYGKVSEVDLYVGNEPPPEKPSSLSRAQKTAILISGLIAFALLIVVSLSLLPPAPAIPH